MNLPWDLGPKDAYQTWQLFCLQGSPVCCNPETLADVHLFTCSPDLERGILVHFFVQVTSLPWTLSSCFLPPWELVLRTVQSIPGVCSFGFVPKVMTLCLVSISLPAASASVWFMLKQHIVLTLSVSCLHVCCFPGCNWALRAYLMPKFYRWHL